MNELLVAKIFEKIKKAPSDEEAYRDLLDYCIDEDTPEAHEVSKKLRGYIGKSGIETGIKTDGLYRIYDDSLKFDAKVDLDSYMIFMELHRKPSERFYQPRRRVLKQGIDAFQALADDRLDELMLSQPPRTGKTTWLMFAMTWLTGRDSERSNLYSAFSDIITKAFYNGILEIITDKVTYRWSEVFPNAKIVQTNAADETINIDRKKRYPSFTSRSLYGTLNGACDCDGFLISDDLIGGIEEALNRERMISAWSKVENNLLTRAKKSAKIVWCGTRWSVVDPIGIRQSILETDENFKNRRVKIINLPALDANDESNFDYDFDVGFTTDWYKQKRASFEATGEIASWSAQYQGTPIEREGALFKPDDMRYYDGVLPDEEPDRIFAPVDPAFGGGDFTSCPVCYQYGDDIYVHEVVFDNSDKKTTIPMIGDAAERNKVHTMRIEANKTLASYVDELTREIRGRGVRINITSKAASSAKSKDQRIFDKAPDIRQHMIFRVSGKRNKAYEQFMQNVFSYKLLGKNKHDDAPDSLAMAIDMVYRAERTAKIIDRPF